MAARVSALRQSALEAGEQLGERASQLFEEAQRRNLLTLALVAVSGFTLGMLAGILIAPASGYETRHRIGDRASETYKGAMRMVGREAEEMKEEAEKIA